MDTFQESFTFEEFLDPEEYIDLGHLFTTDQIFSSKDELVEWAKQIAMNAKTFLIITRYQRARTFDHRLYVTLACERGGSVRKYKKPLVDDEEEEIPKKSMDRMGRKNSCFYGLGFQKIYNVVAKIKRDRMQGRNTVEEVLRLSAERSYTVVYRNGEDSNVLSDIVVAHPTSIAILRTWPYVLIMDTTYKTNKYCSGLIVQHTTIRMCRDDSNRQELHSGNSFYVQRTGNDIQMGSSTNQALIFYICYVGWSGFGYQ
ncbi:hypothetical protein M9H77_02628 [Catharanthus roseus]|uniref:Uncharacterized protein n=1 Tax=Catharanthus roseus TaxID=4058 RepID=A0ACC0C9F3_CATRO|nr:hypothetical protein M9H77_02628 [Catharanthus roseus]